MILWTVSRVAYSLSECFESEPKMGSVLANEHATILKYKLPFNSFVNISAVRN